jgi:hypothetical protein
LGDRVEATVRVASGVFWLVGGRVGCPPLCVGTGVVGVVDWQDERMTLRMTSQKNGLFRDITTPE